MFSNLLAGNTINRSVMTLSSSSYYLHYYNIPWHAPGKRITPASSDEHNWDFSKESQQTMTVAEKIASYSIKDKHIPTPNRGTDKYNAN
jgi:hypothetical protein